MPGKLVSGHIARVGQDPSDSKSNRSVTCSHTSSSGFDAFIHLRYTLLYKLL